MNLRNIIAVVAISASTAVLSVWGFSKYQQHQFAGIQDGTKLPVNYAGFFGNNNQPSVVVDFTPAATSATPAVVHIKTKIKARQVSNSQSQRRNPFSDLFGDDFGDFFGGPRVIPEQRASGSGVLITDDGYIVTNNHVVDNADELTVTLANKKTYKGTVVGTDASSDLAVIKIDGKGLPYMVYGNSDDTKLGQWVLAIGYPLSLDVTVTAGIISAKSRSIGINRRQSGSPIESFLQTDAAVNPGNSGGALVNTNGELIGINSAIASPTGSYAGYSYAIPVNIVKKVITDIVKFGAVQRAYIGINYMQDNLTEEEIKQYEKESGLTYKEGEGVFVTGVPTDGAAATAGVKKGDIITKINGVAVTSGPELQEQVSRYKPGDRISLTYTRSGKESTTNLVLKNKAGNTDVVKNTGILQKLGAELVNVDSKTASANQIAGGVIVKKINDGLLKRTRMQEGFIITSVDNEEVKNVTDLDRILSQNKGRKIKIEGIYPGYENTYPYPLDLSDVD
jgi:serine protease Do